MTEDNNDLENCGAIWKRKSKSGNEYMSMSLNEDETKYLVFPNKNKKEDKHPDYTVHKKK